MWRRSKEGVKTARLLSRAGKEPRSHQSILKCVAVVEALETSVNSKIGQRRLHKKAVLINHNQEETL